jgi:hypothetical protein
MRERQRDNTGMKVINEKKKEVRDEDTKEIPFEFQCFFLHQYQIF